MLLNKNKENIEIQIYIKENKNQYPISESNNGRWTLKQ